MNLWRDSIDDIRICAIRIVGRVTKYINKQIYTEYNLGEQNAVKNVWNDSRVNATA